MIEITQGSLWLILGVAYVFGYLAGRSDGKRSDKGGVWYPAQPTGDTERAVALAAADGRHRDGEEMKTVPLTGRIAPCSWVLAEHEGAGGFCGVPVIHKWAKGYAVVLDGDRLSASGEWTYPPQPSSRSDAWIAEHTFPSLEAAESALRANTEWSRERAAEAVERARRTT